MPQRRLCLFQTDTWTPIAPMRTARKRFALAALRGKLYAFGGYKQSSVEAYDPATGEWAEVGEMPEQRWNMGVVTHAGRWSVSAVVVLCCVQTQSGIAPAQSVLCSLRQRKSSMIN
ncbi:Influenza virus NS1A-binding protein homolog A [Eumeta japonica]|uniref:Influenza virus NS1A-binding protein homolog A n=1 Tax=Eumeta variegata TaxID=151549 RepID=A0A4C2A1J8_EUMVA|nr:Influenza virus NS1A-binding protein homolog A [Eumeta japonica]